MRIRAFRSYYRAPPVRLETHVDALPSSSWVSNKHFLFPVDGGFVRNNLDEGRPHDLSTQEVFNVAATRAEDESVRQRLPKKAHGKNVQKGNNEVM